MSKVDDALLSIFSLGSSTERALGAAGLVSTLLRIKNVQPVVVGALAYDRYAEHLDTQPTVLIEAKTPHLPVRIIYEVMSEMLHAQGHQREWNLLGVNIHFGGQFISNHSDLCREVPTDFGIVTLMPVEQLLADLIVATNGPNSDAVATYRAKHLMSVALQDQVEMDWTKLREIADSENYRVGELVAQLRQETKAEMDAALSGAPAPAETSAAPTPTPVASAAPAQPEEDLPAPIEFTEADDVPSTKKETSMVLPAEK